MKIGVNVHLKHLGTINFKLLLVLILTSFIPLVYSTTRIHFLGNLPEPWAFSIAAQVAWLNVGYEVISETLLIPLAFILGQVITDEQAYQKRVSTSLGVVLSCYLGVTLIVILLTPSLVNAMQQQNELVLQTIDYIRLESIAIFISSVFAFFSLVLVLKNNQRALYGLLAIQTVFTLLCDSFLVSQFSFSLALGVNGIAITNIMVNLLLALISIAYLSRSGIKLGRFSVYRQVWLKEWIKIGWKSGLESLVRNTAFIVMILQLINQVQQSGPFWVTNQFIWGWLLLPILALGRLIKQDAATNKGLSPERVNHYFLLTFGFIVIWLLTIPVWESFIHRVMGIKNATEIVQLALLMVGFYIIFSFNNVIDSYFYGIGRTDLMLYQSLIVNSVFYGGAFMAYQIGWFEPSLNKIAIMFGLGITVDAVITFAIYVMLRRQEQSTFSTVLN
ncbi:multidrug transporter [Vibrionales bacterium C3R12]|nr:multidrug transporter [Vibrionales bacterium C3R12]